MSQEISFTGFPAGGRATAVPNAFFSHLLPSMDDQAEIVVTLYFFFLWQQVRRYPRYIAYNDLAGEPSLRKALSHLPGGSDAALREGLALAVRRKTVLEAPVEGQDAQASVYLLNVAAARRTMERLAKTSTRKGEEIDETGDSTPNVFTLYEDNIGAISPLIVQDLIDSEERYPAEWLTAAFREAVRQNKRNWRYIQRILERWAIEGPDYEKAGRDSAASRRGSSTLERYRRLRGE
jgi:DnaD/phage-associated family protein